MNPESTIIFTDGSSRGNPGPGGWGAVIVFNDSESKVESGKSKVIELGGREDHTTNNRMELVAAISALSFLSSSLSTMDYGLTTIFTDSRYLINGITEWVAGWQKNNWKTKAKEEVLNRDLWEKLSGLVEGKKIEWKYVGGHAGVVGNERCDIIATQFADGNSPALYEGAIQKYEIKDILNIKEDQSKASTKSKSKSSGKPAFSYLSMIDGKIEKHQTWSECEARVKGKSGAKFKKSLSQSDEENIIQEWKK